MGICNLLTQLFVFIFDFVNSLLFTLVRNRAPLRGDSGQHPRRSASPSSGMVGKGQIEGCSGDWEERAGTAGVQRAESLKKSLDLLRRRVLMRLWETGPLRDIDKNQ